MGKHTKRQSGASNDGGRALEGQPKKYCATCGRLITPSHKDFETMKYCSKRCRSKKPNGFDVEIEDAFVRIANEKGSVECGVVQALMESRRVENSSADAGEEKEGDGTDSASDNQHEDLKAKQERGMDVAAFREQVRRAGRRVIAAGKDGQKFECVQRGQVVEPSFAKGEWSVRLVKQ